jgi:hypothetical protein
MRRRSRAGAHIKFSVEAAAKASAEKWNTTGGNLTRARLCDGNSKKLEYHAAPRMNRIVVFSGHAHPDLARALCRRLKVPLSPSTTTTFSNDCLGVQLEANCRQADVFIVQPLMPPVQHHLME